MTTPSSSSNTVLQIPKAEFPYVNRVVSDPPFPPTDGKPSQPITWALGEDHPLVDKYKIVRMYLVMGAGVEVYSAAENGKVGTRNVIPWSMLKLTEEIMDAATFVDEIAHAEEDEDEGDDDKPKTTNGSAATTSPA